MPKVFMIFQTRVSAGGSIEGCCGLPVWQGQQTLSVPACLEVVCRVGEQFCEQFFFAHTYNMWLTPANTRSVCLWVFRERPSSDSTDWGH